MLVSPPRSRRSGRQDHVVRVDAVRSRRRSRSRRRRSELSHQSSVAPSVSPVAVRRERSSRPSSRRCSITSGTPPARKTRTVGMRGRSAGVDEARHARLTSIQSSTVGRGSPAAWAMAGHVQQQVRRAAEGRVDGHGVAERAVGHDVAPVRPRAIWREQRRAPSGAPRRARSAGPTARARCAAGTGRAPPPTTCDVAAVPRNWQPPPGEAHARQPSSAASCSVMWPWAKRAPIGLHLARVLAVARRQRDAARDDEAGQIAHAGERHHHGGQALVAGGDAEHARARGQRADEPPQDDGGVVAVGQAVEHARACPACGRRRDRCSRRRTGCRPARAAPRPPPARAGRPPSGRCGSRARRRAVGVAHAAVRAEDQDLGPAQLRGRPAHAGVLRPAEQVAARPVERDPASGAGCPRDRAARRSRERAIRPPSRGRSRGGAGFFVMEALDERDGVAQRADLRAGDRDDVSLLEPHVHRLDDAGAGGQDGSGVDVVGPAQPVESSGKRRWSWPVLAAR